MKIKHLNVWFFALLLLGLSLVDMLTPSRAFSELENRYLTQRPSFSLDALFSGRFTPSFEAYVDDQFLARESWMQLKSHAEALQGKTENNDVIIGKDGYLFHKWITIPEQFHRNMEALKAFEAMYPHMDIAFLLAPNSYTVLSDKVPKGLYNVDQAQLISDAYAQLKAQGIDTLQALKGIENAYYRLDHHWTTLGAYEAYKAYCLSRGLIPVEATQWQRHEVPHFYGTFYSAAKRFDGKSDTIVYYDMPHARVWIDGDEKGGLYDLSFTKGKDKYGLFLYNNPAHLTIKSTYPDARGHLLVIKDSYANSMIPFLTAHYETIDVIDLRHFNGRVSSLLSENTYDDLLILYNVVTFSEDIFIRKLVF